MPVRLMITFWPSEEVRKRDNQFIVDLCVKDLQDSAGMQLGGNVRGGKDQGRKGRRVFRGGLNWGGARGKGREGRVAHLQRRMCFEGVLHLQGRSVSGGVGLVSVAHLQGRMCLEGVLHLRGRSG